MICFGTLLFDETVSVENDFLKKYNLKPNNAVRAGPELDELFKEILTLNPNLQPGGSILNTSRVFQWITEKSYPITLVGSVGRDNFGKIIKDTLLEEKINFHLLEVEGQQTGVCAVLLNGKNRSLVTHLGTAEFFTVNNLDDAIWKDVHNSKYLYISALSIRANMDVLRKIISRFSKNGKFVILNLGASILCEKYPKELLYLFESADIIFGNESEYLSLCKLLNVNKTDNKHLLLAANEYFKNKPARTLIMTRGCNSVFVLHASDVEEFEIAKLDEDKIVDTNGAGDAFVAGFLAQFVKEKYISECVKCGAWASAEVIQNVGCKFNNKKMYKF